MKREIKFRVWDNLAHCYWGEGEGMDFKKIAFNFYDTLFEESRLVFEEYTGLKDKNGKEIYEGDIITYTSINSKDYKAEIVFSPTLAAFVLDTSGRHLLDDKYGDYYELHKDHSYEIIGNIFENSELLEL